MSAIENKVANPFGSAAVVASPTGASAAAIVQREVAEIQAAMTIAKKFPRDPITSMDKILNACARPSLAEDATYTYARGNQEVTGASIRLAEQLARDWGNIQCGVIELTRMNGVSECLTYAWDLETNFKDEKRFQVKHWRDTKQGGYAVKDERDIYEIMANMAARRKRACILAVIPGDVQEAALHQCEVTLKTHVEITPEKTKALTESFAQYGVTAEMIEKKIQRRLDSILPAQVVQLRRIFSSLKDGMGVATDYFEAPEQNTPAQEGSAATQTQAVKDMLKNKQPPKAENKTTPESKTKDLGGALPIYSTETAIKALREAGEIKVLDEAWDAILKDYGDTKRQVPPEIDEAYKANKERLTKL